MRGQDLRIFREPLRGAIHEGLPVLSDDHGEALGDLLVCARDFLGRQDRLRFLGRFAPLKVALQLKIERTHAESRRWQNPAERPEH